MNPSTGLDLDPELVCKIADLLEGKYVAGDPKEEAQLRELGFWRWVAYEGYAGKEPLAFADHQSEFMTRCFGKTGWDINRFQRGSIFELGCGPLGMIEFVPAASRYAYDPLNKEYSKLFENLRQSSIKYISDEEEISEISLVDFGICFNVLDHTEDAKKWFDLFLGRIKEGGNFLLQVNLVKDGYDRTEEHKKMHPSPLTVETTLEWLSAVSKNFEYQLDQEPSQDNEFFFMAWGEKYRPTLLEAFSKRIFGRR